MDKKNDEKPIIIYTTEEMANWMHPQNEERKEEILKQVEKAKKRFRKRKHKD